MAFIFWNGAKRTGRTRRNLKVIEITAEQGHGIAAKALTNKFRTFGTTSCRDMLAKLAREVSRPEAAKALEDAADHGTNAAVTAWHLVDWIWVTIKQDQQLRARVTAGTGKNW